MNKFIVYSLLFIVFSGAGCTMRAESYKRDRVDQELKGNRGYIMGTVPSLPEKEKKTTRTMYNIEIELPTLSDFERPEQRKTAPTVTTEPATKARNKGYIQSKDTPVTKTCTVKEEKTRTAPEPAQTPQVICQRVDEKVEKTEKAEKVYVVKEGDTLQKISNKLFGTTKRWKNIFEANKNVLKSPNKIKPGQKLVIPMD